MELKIPGRSPGEDLTIMNTFVKRYRNEDDKYEETLVIVYRDNTTGLKYEVEFINPDYEYYTIKPEYRVSYNRNFVEISHCDCHRVKRIGLEKDIFTALGLKERYNAFIREGDRKSLRAIHKHPDVFMSDNNIEDHYRFWFANTYQNSICPITKAFFDIESDGIDIPGKFPEPGECPVNAITIVYQDRKEVYTFLLRSSRNPQIAEFEANLQQNLVELKQFVLEHVSENNRTPDGVPFYFGLDEFNFKMFFYDENKEIDLIYDFFRSVNMYKPDFCLAWNQAFDIPYLIARIQVLGYRPEDFICHPDFNLKECYYFIDERSKNEFEERCDYFACSSYSVWLDQMIQFASRRKGQTKLLSYGLDAIGELIANVRKLDYKDITDRIEELPYKDYKTFVFYNVCDTIVQYCIEHYTQDVEYVFSKCLMNNTRYSKIHRQTVYLANRGQDNLWKDGYIKGNNINGDNEGIPYPGAFVANPLLVGNYSRKLINGNPSNIFENAFDSDYKSLYPSIMRQFNEFPHSQIGFVDLGKQKIHDKQDRTHFEYYTAGGQFIEDLQSHQWLEFAHRWFHLPDFESLVKLVKYVFSKEIRPSRPIDDPSWIIKDENGHYNPFVIYPEPYFPIISNDDRNGNRRPFIFEDRGMSEDLKSKIEGWVKHVENEPNQSF